MLHSHGSGEAINQQGTGVKFLSSACTFSRITVLIHIKGLSCQAIGNKTSIDHDP